VLTALDPGDDRYTSKLYVVQQPSSEILIALSIESECQTSLAHEVKSSSHHAGVVAVPASIDDSVHLVTLERVV